MIKVKVSSKGQLVIPKSLREQTGIKPGKEVLMDRTDHMIILMKTPDDPLEYMIELGKELHLGDLKKEIKEMRGEWKR